MNKNLEYVDIAECKSEGNFVKAICFKPKMAPIICLILGAIMMIPNNMWIRLMGVVFIFMAFLVIKMVRDFKVMDIFDKGIMFYGDEEAKTACFVSFDEIESWNVNHENGHDVVEVKLNDGRQVFRDTFEADLAYKALNVLLHEKDEKYLKALRDRENQLSIPDALNNIRKSFKKK